MSNEKTEHVCQYESVEAPGRIVPSIIISWQTLHKIPILAEYLSRVGYMRTRELYRCVLCRRYVYVTASAQCLPLCELPAAC